MHQSKINCRRHCLCIIILTVGNFAFIKLHTGEVGVLARVLGDRPEKKKTKEAVCHKPVHSSRLDA